MSPILPVLILTTLGATRALGQDLIASDFGGSSPAENLPIVATTHIAPGLSTSGWTLGAGVGPVTGVDDQLAFNIPATNAVEGTTLAEAITENDFLALTLTPSAPIDLGGQRLSFAVERASWFSPRQYSVFTSVAGFDEADELFRTPLLANGDVAPASPTFSFIFPLTGYDDVAAPIEIRLYASRGRYNNHVASLAAFSITDPGPVFSVEAEAEHGGNVATNPASPLFTAGEMVTLTAEPPAGFRFAGWQGTSSSDFNPLSIEVSQNESVTAQFVRNAPDQMGVSTNLPQIAYWFTASPFTDLMRYAGAWAAPSGGAPPTLTTRGYPTGVPYDDGTGTMTNVRTNVATFVAGAHQVTFEGSGSIRFTGGAVSGNQIFTANGTLDIIDPALNCLLLIDVSDPADPVRDIHVHLPGFDETTTFHPDYLEDLEPYTSLRFMDWGQTNTNPVTSWSEVPPVDYYSQGRSAVPLASYELIIELANLTGKAPWICVPHLVDDDFVIHLAELIRDTLDPGLRVYLEYSNETWNGAPGFLQTYYARAQGLDLGLSTNAVEAGSLFTAMRSAQIWQIFRDAFDGQDPGRVVNVMPSWSGNFGVSDIRLSALADPTINPSGITADALAIAPYFGHGIQSEEIDATGYPTVDDLVTGRSVAAIAEERLDIREQKRVADAHGTRLICYEGGQHWAVPGDLSTDQTLIGLISATNSDPRMGERYTEYFDMMREEGIDQFFHFQLTEPHSQFGFFGAYEFQNQTLTDAPKARSIIEWVAANPVRSELSIDLASETGSLPLFSGRRYTVESSADLSTWTPVPGGANLWGDHTQPEIPISGPAASERGFWRIRPD